jgi:UDP-3-O-[3-hydroxymyristoyl] N-acetylglucosamine deacetylase
MQSILWQQTLKQSLTFSGIGLHQGRPVQVTITPAGANYGLRFVRADLPGQPEIQAHYSKVVDTTRATTLGEGRATLATVEHLLAALRGAGVDNGRIAVDGPEVPIMDGSAAPFAQLLAATGFRTLAWPRSYLWVQRPVELRDGDQWMRVVPGEPRITYSIDFSHPLIRRQRYTVPLKSRVFEQEIAPARTFGFLKEVQYLQTNGLALGGSLDNAVVLDDSGVLNPDGFRFPEECVRHKILDAMGDLALLGMPLFGRLEVSRGSHDFHLRFLQHLMKQEASWRIWVPSPRVRERSRAWVQPTLWEGMPA